MGVLTLYPVSDAREVRAAWLNYETLPIRSFTVL